MKVGLPKAQRHYSQMNCCFSLFHQLYQKKSMVIPSCPSPSSLVGGFNPSEKYARQNGFIFPNFRGENKKTVKPTPSQNISKFQKYFNQDPTISPTNKAFLVIQKKLSSPPPNFHQTKTKRMISWIPVTTRLPFHHS